MTSPTIFVRPRPTALTAALGLVLAFGLGCSRIEELTQAQNRATEANRQAEARELAAQDRLDDALAAEAEAKQATEAALAEREALAQRREELLGTEEAQLRRREELSKRAARLAEQERSLAVRAKQLDNVEANLAFQENELAKRERAMNSPPARKTEEEFEDELEPVTNAQPLQATLQPGRLLEVEILETLSSRTSRVGDTFSASLMQDLTTEDGMLVVAAGAEVIGRVVDVVPLKTVGGQASLDVEFTHIVVSPTETVAISASFVEVGVDRRKDKKKIAGAAIVGAILGRLLGGDGEGLIAGAAAGTAAVARAKGKDAQIPAGTAVALQLEEVVTVSLEMTGPADR